MKKNCPICRLEKDEEDFNIEHPIPETIGGFYEIEVCIVCNRSMNENIDEPFLANPKILQFRNIFSTKKQSNRKIQNQLKFDDEKYTYYFDKNGNLKGHLKPCIPKIENLEIGEKVEITIDKKDFNNRNKIIEKLEKRNEVKFGQVEIIYNKTPKKKLKIEFSNDPVILELIKIAYLIAINEIPEYYNDEDAIKLSKMLHSGNIDSKLLELIQPLKSKLIVERIKEKINTTISTYGLTHFVYFKGIKNIGLISFIQIFDFRRILVLSKSEMFENYPEKLIVNEIR